MNIVLVCIVIVVLCGLSIGQTLDVFTILFMFLLVMMVSMTSLIDIT